MTCFWTNIILSLNIEDFKLLNFNKKPSIIKFINTLKTKNKKKNNILWQGQKISQKQLEENFLHIKDFNINTINNGYLCSICDPFLILICELLNINIEHTYLNILIIYKNENSNKTLKYKSSKSHFSIK